MVTKLQMVGGGLPLMVTQALGVTKAQTSARLRAASFLLACRGAQRFSMADGKETMICGCRRLLKIGLGVSLESARLQRSEVSSLGTHLARGVGSFVRTNLNIFSLPIPLRRAGKQRPVPRGWAGVSHGGVLGHRTCRHHALISGGPSQLSWRNCRVWLL